MNTTATQTSGLAVSESTGTILRAYLPVADGGISGSQQHCVSVSSLSSHKEVFNQCWEDLAGFQVLGAIEDVFFVISIPHARDSVSLLAILPSDEAAAYDVDVWDVTDAFQEFSLTDTEIALFPDSNLILTLYSNPTCSSVGVIIPSSFPASPIVVRHNVSAAAALTAALLIPNGDILVSAMDTTSQSSAFELLFQVDRQTGNVVFREAVSPECSGTEQGDFWPRVLVADLLVRYSSRKSKLDLTVCRYSDATGKFELQNDKVVGRFGADPSDAFPMPLRVPASLGVLYLNGSDWNLVAVATATLDVSDILSQISQDDTCDYTFLSTVVGNERFAVFEVECPPNAGLYVHDSTTGKTSHIFHPSHDQDGCDFIDEWECGDVQFCLIQTTSPTAEGFCATDELLVVDLLG